MDLQDSSDEKKDDEPVYKPAYQQQQPPDYYNSNTQNNNNVTNPYSIPDNPYGYQIDPVEQVPYSYSYDSGVPPGYYNYNNYNNYNIYSNNNITSNQSDSSIPNTIENTHSEPENVAELQNPIISNQARQNEQTYSSLAISPPHPQYAYDPDAPNCRVVTNENNVDEDENDDTVQNSIKQCGRCCLKCFCTTITIFICIAIISSFMFR